MKTLILCLQLTIFVFLGRGHCGGAEKDANGKGIKYMPATSMSDDFENGIQLTVDKWHKNINQTSNGKSGDTGNHVETSSEQKHSGKYSLKTFTVASPDAQKSGMARELLLFPEGSEFWFSAWYYIVSGNPTKDLYLFELEATRYHYVGRRLALGGANGDAIYVEAKIQTGDKFYQSGTPTPFPKDKWVHLTFHLHLSSRGDGLTEVWQDDRKIIEGHGQNMPSGQVYDWIMIGQTNNDTHHAQTVYVDDVVVSDKPIK